MPRRHPVLRALLVLVVLLVVFGIGWVSGAVGFGRRASPASLTELERQFAGRMKGVTLVGRFTIAGREDRSPVPDRYDIASVEKLNGDQWRFNARVRYGNIDTTLPIVVPIVWAGDTPMIAMTDLTIPTMGTFSVRLLFYGDRYAGTWQHGQVGGQMFGKIEKSNQPLQ